MRRGDFAPNEYPVSELTKKKNSKLKCIRTLIFRNWNEYVTLTDCMNTNTSGKRAFWLGYNEIMFNLHATATPGVDVSRTTECTFQINK